MKFRYVIQVILAISGEELSMIFRCAESHYDGKCKDAAKQGGFLWGMVNRMTGTDKVVGTPLEFNNPPVAVQKEEFLKLPEHEFTLDEDRLDLMLKIWEQATYLGFPTVPIRRKLLDAFNAMQTEWKRLNEPQSASSLQPYADQPATLKLKQDCFAVVREGKPNWMTSFATLEENAKFHAHEHGGKVVPCFIIDKDTVIKTEEKIDSLTARLGFLGQRDI